LVCRGRLWQGTALAPSGPETALQSGFDLVGDDVALAVAGHVHEHDLIYREA